MPCSWPPRSAARRFWSPVPVGGPEPSPSGNVRTRDQLIRTAFMRPHSSGQRPRTGDRQLMNVLSRVRRVNPAFAAAAMVSSMILLAGGLTLAGPASAEQRSAPAPGPPASWAGAWTSGQQALTGTGFADQTLRLLVHPTLGGSVLRIRLANTFGGSDQTFDAVSVAVATSAATADLVPGSVRTVRFGGATSVTIAAGARAISDPISPRGQVRADPGRRPVRELDRTGCCDRPRQRWAGVLHRYRKPGVGKPTGTAFTGQLSSWYWLDGVDVRSARGASGSVVAFGDSLTDGAYSSYNGNKRWTDDLAARLQALPGSRSVGVLNEGIGGNRVLAFRGDCCGNGTSESALARLDRDAIAQTWCPHPDHRRWHQRHRVQRRRPSTDPRPEPARRPGQVRGPDRDRSHDHAVRLPGRVLRPRPGGHPSGGQRVDPDQRGVRKASWTSTERSLIPRSRAGCPRPTTPGIICT